MACEGVIQANLCSSKFCDPKFLTISAYNNSVAPDPIKCWPHVPSKADVAVDASGTEYVLVHCIRCGYNVATKLDSERNVVGEWIFPPTEAA
jgi:hypothetical protein